MADNTTLNPGTGGDDIATDDIGGVKHQRVKVQYGDDGAATDVSDTNPLPVDDAGGSLTVDVGTALPAGTNAIGKLAPNSGVDIGDVDVTSVVPGTGATNLGKAEDAGHTTGDVGVMPLAVRNDTVGSLVNANLDYAPLQVNANGRLRVEGAQLEDAAHASGDPGVHVMGVRNDTPGTLVNANGDYASLQMDGNGNLRVGGIGANGLLKAEDALHASGDAGVMILGVRSDAGGSFGGTDGDYVPLSMTSGGELRTRALASGTIAHDAAASTGIPVALAGISQDNDDTAPPNQVDAENDITRLACTRSGALHTVPHPPRIWDVETEYTTQQTDATVKAAPGAGLSLYITDIYVSAKGTVDVTLEEGTSTFKFRYYASGAGDGVTRNLRTPKKLTANTALTVTTSAAVTVTVGVHGYTAP